MKEITFKISSGLKNIIGKELITNDLIAIFELVKNAYDAQAKNVKIIFSNMQSTNAKIIILDDGNGMSYDDLVNKFLFVGYSEKRDLENFSDYRTKIDKKRYFAGAKGIGRFSCDRLGSKLNLYTKKSNSDEIHKIHIAWGKFEVDQKKEFQIIKPEYSLEKEISLQDQGKFKFHQGTLLEIISLNGTWDSEKLLKLKRYLQRLINPSQLDESQKFSISIEAEEFKKQDKINLEKKEPWNVINGLVENFIFEDLGIKTTEIDSSVSQDGKEILTKLTDKGKYIFSLKEKNPYPKLKNIHTKIFFLNQSAKNTFTRTMGLHPVRYGSIFLYKNGIRVHPYGDESDDWLNLERRKVQGTKRFLSSRELMGRIELNGIQNEFIEVSSRDGGIVKNDNHSQLTQYILSKVIRRLEKYVVEGIEWDQTTSPISEDEIKENSMKVIAQIAGKAENTEIDFNPKLLDIVKEKEITKIPQLIKNLESINKKIKDSKVKDYAEKQLKHFKKAADLLKKDKEDSDRNLEAKKKESLFLTKAISSDTDALINLNHTIGNSTLAITDIIEEINKKIKEKKPIQEISPLIDEISMENEKIKVLADFVSLANFNMKAEWLYNKDIIQYMTEYLERIKTGTMRFKFSNHKTIFKTKFRPLEISILLDNLVSNSKKSSADTMFFSFEIKNKRLHILISDNGKGVGKKDENHIFNRGYTTTKGAGIGLHHIKSILESMEGKISFIGNNRENQEKGACFELILK